MHVSVDHLPKTDAGARQVHAQQEANVLQLQPCAHGQQMSFTGPLRWGTVTLCTFVKLGENLLELHRLKAALVVVDEAVRTAVQLYDRRQTAVPDPGFARPCDRCRVPRLCCSLIMDIDAVFVVPVRDACWDETMLGDGQANTAR